ncbi:MAG: hypothetical protein ABUK01_06260 [Leptospirales bacterium]
MTTKTKSPIEALYLRLKNEVGLSKIFIKAKILPEWWDDEIADNQTGYAEAVGYIAKHTGIIFDSLMDVNYPITFPNIATRFYKSNELSEADIDLAKKIAIGVADLIASAIKKPYLPIPKNYIEIRESVLKSEHSVFFQSLLNWCWSHGIAVISIRNFPKGAKKMKAMISFTKENPVIVLCDGHQYNAWLLFHLVHEIGHLALGHVEVGRELIDTDIKNPLHEYVIEQNNNNTLLMQEEKEATLFGTGIITGDPDMVYQSNSHLSSKQLAERAIKIAKEQLTDPGFIALNYAWHKNFIPVGMGALRIIETDPDAHGLIKKTFLQNIDTDRLPDESLSYIQRIIG